MRPDHSPVSLQRPVCQGPRTVSRSRSFFWSLSGSLQSRVSTTHSSSSSPYDWSTHSELYPEAETAKGHTRNSTHTLGNGHTTQQPARDSEGELPAVAAAAPLPPPPLLLLLLLLLLLRCCCCCCCRRRRSAATVLLLLHDPRCIAEHKPSQQTVSRFVFFGTHAESSNTYDNGNAMFQSYLSKIYKKETD